MKVVFWSNAAGKGAVTYSVLAVATYAALKYSIKSSIVPLQFSNDELIHAFISEKNLKNLKVPSTTGMDALLRLVYSGNCDVQDVKDVTISPVVNKLFMFLPTKINTVEGYEDRICPCLGNLLSILGESFDLSFIDTAAGQDKISLSAIANTDKIVVCVPQSYVEIDKLFREYNFNPDKFFFLFTDYDQHSLCSVRNVQKHYRKIVNEFNSAVIPHYAGFSDAINCNSLVRFVLKNLNCSQRSADYQFIQELDRAVEKILRFCGVKVGRR